MTEAGSCFFFLSLVGEGRGEGKGVTEGVLRGSAGKTERRLVHNSRINGYRGSIRVLR